MNLSPYTLSLLEDIERRIDPEVEDDLYDQWKKFWNGEITTPVFDPMRKKVSPIGVEIKKININDALGDIELMLDRELADVASRLSGKNKALGIRANYGTGILSSLFPSSPKGACGRGLRAYGSRNQRAYYILVHRFRAFGYAFRALYRRYG